MVWWKFWARNGTNGIGAPDYYEEGVALLRQEQYHDALTSFRLALKQRPDDPATLEQIAVVYTRIGLTDDAVRSYARALDARPSSPAAHYGLAFLLLKNRRGEQARAREHLEAFLEHARPDREDARHIQHARRTLERLSARSGEPAAR